MNKCLNDYIKSDMDISLKEHIQSELKKVESIDNTIDKLYRLLELHEATDYITGDNDIQNTIEIQIIDLTC